MSPAANASEREKYYRLRDLANAQIKAIEREDFNEFDRIMAEKDDVIRGLGSIDALLDADPALSTVCDEIRDRDKTAMRLLFDRLGRLKRQIAGLNQYQTARNAYRVGSQPTKGPESLFANDAPRFIDKRS